MSARARCIGTDPGRSRPGADRGEISDMRIHHPLLIVCNCLIRREIVQDDEVLDTLYATFPALHEGF